MDTPLNLGLALVTPLTAVKRPHYILVGKILQNRENKKSIANPLLIVVILG